MISLLLMGMRGVTMVAKFVLTIFIARYCGLDILGQYGLVAATTMMAPVAAGLGILYGISRDAVTLPKPQLRDSLQDYWLLATLIYVPIGLVAVAFGVANDDLLVPVMIWLLMWSEHLGGDMFTIGLSIRRPLFANLMLFVRTTAWVFLYIPAVLLAPSLTTLTALIGFWLAASLTSLLMFFVATRTWGWHLKGLDIQNIWGTLVTAWTRRLYYVNEIANAAAQNIDRYIINLVGGHEMTGIYVFFWSIANAINQLVSTGVTALYRPLLVKAFDEADEPRYWATYRTAFIKAISLALALAVGLFAMSGLISELTGRAQLVAHKDLLAFVLLGMVVRVANDYVGYALYTRRRDLDLFTSAVATLVLFSMLSLALVPTLGIMGAPLGMILGYSAIAVYRAVLLRNARVT